MQHDKRPLKTLKARYRLFYILSVVALAVLLCANFGVIYTLLVTPPENPENTMRFVYLIMVAGFIVLAAQALLIFTRFISLLGSEAETVENLNDQLKQLAVYDSLTKVYNRYKFESVVRRELDNVNRYGSPLTGIIFDIDNFKGINETHGYSMGDKLLVNLAAFVSGKLRNSDYVFRWRGGKFIILAPHTNEDKAAMVAEKLRQIVGHKLFGGTIRMSLSLGVVQGKQNDSMETFLHRLQSALTGAKHGGKNCVFILRD
ncbi:GGDEF domain-containing protein [Pseudodesulfovibrio piezophilus]|uniref:diguanylate cyclase n=1 Tax=Pseudodesulfovibrio piezophilus (strain DSM 21447 / JCM 15486 / C1TLV30) TaxID=1322246 RepID=M1WKI4_PSEP2|nr:GGDEF domain-containing protein [Pseudodesulfovibrio piezophilus]CCH49656.1 Diguanylate cyclase [Pseudodesulfovibrio piezophilus C1TLV30]